MLSSGTKRYHLGQNVIAWDEMLSSGATVMLSSGTKSYHLGQNFIIWDEMLSSAANVIIWEKLSLLGSDRVRRGSDSSVLACCTAGPISNLGSAPQRRPSTEQCSMSSIYKIFCVCSINIKINKESGSVPSNLKMLLSGMKCYHLELMLSSGTKCYHLGLNVLIWDEM
jgi:hypothetical protein